MDNVTGSYENTTVNTTENTLFIIHAGTNDIKQTESQALLAKDREMIKKYKVKLRTNCKVVARRSVLLQVKKHEPSRNTVVTVNPHLRSHINPYTCNHINSHHHNNVDLSTLNVINPRPPCIQTLVPTLIQTRIHNVLAIHKYIKVCYLNARNIRNKVQDLEEIVCLEECDIIGVMKSWIDSKSRFYS